MNRILALFTTMGGTGPRPDDPRWVGDAERCLADLDELVGRPLRDILEETGRERLVLSAAGILVRGPARCHRRSRGPTDRRRRRAVRHPGIGWAAGVEERPARQADAVTAAALVDPTIPLAQLEGQLVAATHRRTAPVNELIPLRSADLGAAVASSRVVHLAAHASWNRLEFIRSGLALGSGDSLDSGELFAALDLNGTDLAVLSACDTASGSLFATGEAINLASMMLMAGARQVVASLGPSVTSPPADHGGAAPTGRRGRASQRGAAHRPALRARDDRSRGAGVARPLRGRGAGARCGADRAPRPLVDAARRLLAVRPS